MDALPTTHPVSSSLRPKQFLSANPSNPLHLLKPAVPQSHASLPPFANLSAKRNPASIAPKPIPARSAHRSHPAVVAKFTGQTHRKAATGYAAALLDVAACGGQGQLAAVARDVRRFTRAVRAVLEDGGVGEAAKGEVLTKVVEGGGFYAKLAVLVRMLVRKGKVRMVGEVMEEFGRLWGELYVRETNSSNGII